MRDAHSSLGDQDANNLIKDSKAIWEKHSKIKALENQAKTNSAQIIEKSNLINIKFSNLQRLLNFYSYISNIIGNEPNQRLLASVLIN